MFKVLTSFEIKTGEHSVKVLNPKELMTLVIWLVEAYNNPEVKPLRLFNQGLSNFCWIEDGVVHFQSQNDQLTMKEVGNLVSIISKNASESDIREIRYLPEIYNHPEGPYYYNEVKVIDEVLGYFNNEAKAFNLPIGLGYNSKDDWWYGIESSTSVSIPSRVGYYYKFSDLTVGKI